MYAYDPFGELGCRKNLVSAKINYRWKIKAEFEHPLIFTLRLDRFVLQVRQIEPQNADDMRETLQISYYGFKLTEP